MLEKAEWSGKKQDIVCNIENMLLGKIIEVIDISPGILSITFTDGAKLEVRSYLDSWQDIDSRVFLFSTDKISEEL